MKIDIPTGEGIEALGLTPKKTETLLRRLEVARNIRLGQHILFEYRGGIRLGKVTGIHYENEEPAFTISEVEGLAGTRVLSVSCYHACGPFIAERYERFQPGQWVWWNDGHGVQEGRIQKVTLHGEKAGRRSFLIHSAQGKDELIQDYQLLGRAFEGATRFDPFLRRDK